MYLDNLITYHFDNPYKYLEINRECIKSTQKSWKDEQFGCQFCKSFLSENECDGISEYVKDL